MRNGQLRSAQGEHLNERNFRRYEPIIEKIVNAYPEPYSFTPKNLRASSALIQLRNAINAVLHHKFITPIDLDKLAEVKFNSEFFREENKITVATRASREQAMSKVDVMEFVPFKTEREYITIEKPTHALLNAMALLIIHKVITDPVIIHKFTFDYPVPEGIYLEPNADGTFVMI